MCDSSTEGQPPRVNSEIRRKSLNLSEEQSKIQSELQNLQPLSSRHSHLEYRLKVTKECVDILKNLDQPNLLAEQHSALKLSLEAKKEYIEILKSFDYYGLFSQQRRVFWSLVKSKKELEQPGLTDTERSQKEILDHAAANAIADLKHLVNIGFQVKNPQDQERLRDWGIMIEWSDALSKLQEKSVQDYRDELRRPHLKACKEAVEKWMEIRKQRADCDPADAQYQQFEMSETIIAKWILAFLSRSPLRM